MESNRHRHFRHYANACEMLSGASLNSAVIYGFQLLQVPAVGYVVALGIAHFYFGATTITEGGRRVVNFASGSATGLSMFAATSEPMGKHYQSVITESSINSELAKLDKSNNLPINSWLIAGLIAIALLAVARGRR